MKIRYLETLRRVRILMFNVLIHSICLFFLLVYLYMMGKFWRHLIFWIVVYFTWAFMKMGSYLDFEFLIVNLVHLGAYVLTFYSLRNFLIPFYYDRGHLLIFGISIIMVSALILLLWYLGMMLVSLIIEIPGTTIPRTPGGFVLEAIQFFVPGMFLLVWESYDERMSIGEEAHRLSRDKIASELNLLKAQVNPDFLISSLRHLKNSVDLKSAKAPDMILRLSSILDYVLHDGQKDVVTLSEEIQATNYLIELQELRLGSHFQSKIHIDGDVSKPIAPLIFFSLVEGLMSFWTTVSEGKLSLTTDVRQEDDHIRCSVTINKNHNNSEKPRRASIHEHFKNYRRRLTLLYPQGCHFKLSDESDFLEASIHINGKNG